LPLAVLNPDTEILYAILENGGLLSLSVSGELEQLGTYSGDLEDVAMDYENDLIWLAGENTITVLDSSGAVLASQTESEEYEFESISADGEQGLFVAAEEKLVHYIYVNNVLNKTVYEITVDEVEIVLAHNGVYITGEESVVLFNSDLSQQLSIGVNDEVEAIAKYIDRFPPTLTINHPENNSYLNVSTPVLTAVVEDIGSGVDVDSVSIKSNGSLIAGDCSLVGDELTCSTSQLQDGSHDISLTINDIAGNMSAASEVSIIIDTIPPAPIAVTDISVTQNASGDFVLTLGPGAAEPNAQVLIENLTTNAIVSGIANSDGSITLTINGAQGDVVRIIVSDAAGNKSQSNEVALITLNVVIESHQNGDEVSSNEQLVYGRYTGPINAGIVVNGVLAAITEDKRFVANRVSVNDDGSMQAVIRTIDGMEARDTKTVNVIENTPGITVDVSRYTILESQNVTFNISVSRTDISNVALDVDGNGVSELESTNRTITHEHSYPTKGVYICKVTVTYLDGTEESSECGIAVIAGKYINSIIFDSWQMMNEHIAAFSYEDAAQYMNLHAKEQYLVVMQILQEKMVDIISSYSPIQRIRLDEVVGTYAVTRELPNGTKVFFITYMRDVDGVWRLHSM
jgi:hypothetical protein